MRTLRRCPAKGHLLLRSYGIGRPKPIPNTALRNDSGAWESRTEWRSRSPKHSQGWHSGSQFIQATTDPDNCLVLPRFNLHFLGRGSCKLLKRWSGRRGSNPRRPAWEVTRHFNFRHLESAGVGLESTETPGKTAVHRERLLMECNWSAARAKQELPETALR